MNSILKRSMVCGALAMAPLTVAAYAVASSEFADQMRRHDPIWNQVPDSHLDQAGQDVCQWALHDYLSGASATQSRRQIETTILHLYDGASPTQAEDFIATAVDHFCGQGLDTPGFQYSPQPPQVPPALQLRTGRPPSGSAF
ncbi:DUF732 domain-containing protein [Nocardia sp. alder85J]|uniref:DUF732 domain-containing protein n=1 Tax=Nocardia sp. alder85J TaxID=2862949 RepID=UPI001CD5AC3A|nr:DUF732 domain-containing protein [Nocardia sp. alder85J]MCX4097998.1 DUF732 domain-containing protein [Nocardia sp. alder85J]